MKVKSKIIVHNNTEISDEDAMLYVYNVMSGGKVSETKQGKQYCFVTTFKSGIVVFCTRRNNTYTFHVANQ
jgi:hypothetical protein